MKPIRWSGESDVYLGPFTYAKEKYKTTAVVLGSGDGDEYPRCRLRIATLGHTLIVALPQFIRPWRKKVHVTTWDEATIARLGRDWYWDSHEREYGFSCSEGHFNVFLGRQTHDSSTEQRWSCFLPWLNWRHVRHSIYDLQGKHFATEAKRVGPLATTEGRDAYDKWRGLQEGCPSCKFSFADFDGELLSAETRIEEREWRFGTGWCKWLSLFRKPKIHRSLDIEFSGETGKRKGSWKGGTTGHSIEMLPGELHESAFRRYCAEHDMKFN